MRADSPAAPPSLGIGVLVTSTGGALGAVARWWLTIAFPVAPGHFPRTTLAINVVGSAALAALPLLAVVRRQPWLGLLLGTGVLGGFTTMSAASAETFELLNGGHVGLGLLYCLATLGAAVAAVLAVDRLTTAGQRRELEIEEGDE